MATIDLPILGWSTIPDPADTTDPVFAEPYSILATNDVWKSLVWRFGSSNAAQPTTRIALHGRFQVPQNYVGTPLVVIVWTATLTSGDVVWDFDYRTVAGNDAASLDQAGTEQAVTVTDTAPGATDRRLEVTIALTAGNFAAGETVEFLLARDGADAADTMAGSALLVDAFFRYNDA